jgi:hypothetical protein
MTQTTVACVPIYEALVKRVGEWQVFCRESTKILKVYLNTADGYLEYFEQKANDDSISEFGITCRTVEFSCFVKIDLETKLETRKPGKLHIRQNHLGELIFLAVSPYFSPNDILRREKLLRVAKSPAAFDFAREFDGMVARFIDFIKEWETLSDEAKLFL